MREINRIIAFIKKTFQKEGFKKAGEINNGKNVLLVRNPKDKFVMIE